MARSKTTALSEAPPLSLDPSLFVAGNRVELLRDGGEAFPRMLQEIRASRQCVLLEMYTFASDLTGWKFARALAEADQAGADVRVIYDSLGSRDSREEIFDFMLAHGVQVHEHAPAFPRRWRLTRARRDHRKLVVVDGRVAFVGGLNVSNEYAAESDGGEGWRDTVLRIEGPAVTDLADVFSKTWVSRTRRPCPPFPSPEPIPDGIPVAAVSSEKWSDRRSIARSYLHALQSAQRRIWIENAYFSPSGKFLRALKQARERGVDVRLLVPERTDVMPVYYATRALFARLLRWGVRIFLWKGPMMHAKTAVIDGTWCTAGSYNLDHLSLFHNLELTVIALDRDLGLQFEQMFIRDCENSIEVSRDEWRRRGFWRRILEGYFHIVRFLM
jgi:cardiolipin synthase